MAGCAGGDRIYADYRTSGDYQTSAAGAVAAGNQSGSGFKGVCLSGCTGDDAIMGDYNWIPLDFNWSVTTMNWNLAIAITPRERHRLQVFRGFSLIGGTHPTMRDDKLFNTAYLFTPNGEVHTQDKIHRTRWEKEKWHTEHGNELKVFHTPHAKIAILICYDIEFPELARRVAEEGAEIVFVPSCTDDRQGFLRVWYCCHARAIENQIYVAMTSTVGNLPVAGLRLHYGQASIITPSDFPFARDGIAAEGVLNEEQIIVADVDLALLDENRLKGTTIPLLDKRNDFYTERPVAVVVT